MSNRIKKVRKEITTIENRIQELNKKIENLESVKKEATEFEDYKVRVEELRKLRFERKRLKIDLGKAEKRELNEAQKEIKRIEEEALKVGEEILDALFHTYELTWKLREISGKAYGILREYEDSDLFFNDLGLIRNLKQALMVFIQRQFYIPSIESLPPKTPLRNKIISKMKESGIPPNL